MQAHISIKDPSASLKPWYTHDVILPEVCIWEVSRMRENLLDTQATMVMLINDITMDTNKKCPLPWL